MFVPAGSMVGRGYRTEHLPAPVRGKFKGTVLGNDINDTSPPNTVFLSTDATARSLE